MSRSKNALIVLFLLSITAVIFSTSMVWDVMESVSGEKKFFPPMLCLAASVAVAACIWNALINIVHKKVDF